MPICHGCLENKKLTQNYCAKCIKEVFDFVVPKPLEFDKNEFYAQRTKLAPRMSISGVQDKISLKFEGTKLVTTALDGKYILKPIPTSKQIKYQEDIVFNEHLSMLISKNIFKINTASCALISFSDGEMAYITKRFDYMPNGLKFDQEDFASVLNVTSAKDGPNYKYDSKSYLDCANAIKLKAPASIVVLEDFFKRIVLNYLISNGDAHLKNFSLYSEYVGNDYRLTPNYDILNTRFHINETFGDMALELLDTYTKSYEAVGYYTYNDFYQFSKLIGISDIRFKKFFKFINETQDKVIDLINRSFLSEKAKVYYLENYMDRLKRINYIC